MSIMNFITSLIKLPADNTKSNKQSIFKLILPVKSHRPDLLDAEGLPLKFQHHPLTGAHGQCFIDFSRSNLNVKTYELHSGDLRSSEY